MDDSPEMSPQLATATTGSVGWTAAAAGQGKAVMSPWDAGVRVRAVRSHVRTETTPWKSNCGTYTYATSCPPELLPPDDEGSGPEDAPPEDDGNGPEDALPSDDDTSPPPEDDGNGPEDALPSDDDTSPPPEDDGGGPEDEPPEEGGGPLLEEDPHPEGSVHEDGAW
jgi:hypothetical protein